MKFIADNVLLIKQILTIGAQAFSPDASSRIPSGWSIRTSYIQYARTRPYPFTCKTENGRMRESFQVTLIIRKTCHVAPLQSIHIRMWRTSYEIHFQATTKKTCGKLYSIIHLLLSKLRCLRFHFRTTTQHNIFGYIHIYNPIRFANILCVFCVHCISCMHFQQKKIHRKIDDSTFIEMRSFCALHKVM